MRTTLCWLAAVAMLGTAVTHAITAPEYLSEHVVYGVLFIAAVIGSLAVAALLVRADDGRAWALGSLIAVSTFAGFILSRTTGLPGLHETDWEPIGLASLVCEGGFLLLAAARAAGLAREPEPETSAPRSEVSSRPLARPRHPSAVR